jgi:hypothetical protein
MTCWCLSLKIVFEGGSSTLWWRVYPIPFIFNEIGLAFYLTLQRIL